MTEHTSAPPHGDSDEPEKRGFKPRTQANFIGWYSLVSMALYTGAAALSNQHLLPPWPFYVLCGATYLVFWWSFWLQKASQGAANTVTRVRGLWRWLVDFVRTSGKPASRLVDALRIDSDIREPDDRYDRRDSSRVFALAAAVAFESAWLSCYSGGPFESPYSQVLIGLALLCPVIAYHTSSIVATYAIVGIAAVTFQYALDHDETPTIHWYVATTIMMLVISLISAALANEALRGEVESIPPAE